MKKNISEIECDDAKKLIEKLDLKYNIKFLHWWKQGGIFKLIIVFDNYNSLNRKEIKNEISKVISDIGISSFDDSDCAPSGTNIIEQSLRDLISMPSKKFLNIEFQNSTINNFHIEHTVILRA
ncbi:TPA: hypothetical protein R0J32_004475 [Klebsiella quasipneumoniae]|nr:hypothetical protein [Klebsiella pneumoniae]MDU4075542.1 hypothetical protein [Klebsiella pneumoniae]HEB4938636.1 hypothetical protein [Klebsiella quasipneumoniae]